MEIFINLLRFSFLNYYLCKMILISCKSLIILWLVVSKHCQLEINDISLYRWQQLNLCSKSLFSLDNNIITSELKQTFAFQTLLHILQLTTYLPYGILTLLLLVYATCDTIHELELNMSKLCIHSNDYIDNGVLKSSMSSKRDPPPTHTHQKKICLVSFQ